MLEDELIDDKQVALSLVQTGFGHFPIWLRSLNLPEPDSDRPATTMTTIPARLAKPSQLSLSAAEARKRAIRLYRDWCRSAPEIVQLYALNVSPAYVRHSIRERFEKNRYVTDLRAIDVLLLKGRQEYQETLNCWKQRDHVEGILLAPQYRPQKTFMQKFLEGRDEEAVLPAATGVV
ncbi:hypothetical protein AX14_013240 [Amanita brunnescens Koide BX004]|nr:hypothetical protein AX14_013240 [Amanita brunnescens Koide BX004]